MSLPCKGRGGEGVLLGSHWLRVTCLAAEKSEATEHEERQVQSSVTDLPVTIRTAGQDDRGIQPKGYCGSFVTVKVRSRSFSKGFVWARLPQDDGTWRGRLTKNNQTTQHPFIVPCEDTFGHCTPMYPRMICS
ncbi:hypothetical protein PISMIDRAFT_446426 [Pisolithus microcarpus 441]|uniref:Uncharacterized protein n=1 Tax=Pisolithus microcarpus 441 TaxID=765257 RepID=A0A0C9ZKN5_9AGAM|nr:hypothetical protein PISMIDRAFT_446426 [Pisolithus microcarpus 441]